MNENIKKQVDNLVDLIKKEIEKEEKLLEVMKEYELEKENNELLCEILEVINENPESLKLLLEYEKE